MSLPRGPSWFWAFMHRIRIARPLMPFWRVVVEARPDRAARRWPHAMDAAVTAVFVWANSAEEAEALARLALEREGLAALTADATKCAPAAAPRREPCAVARTAFGYLASAEGETDAARTLRRDA